MVNIWLDKNGRKRIYEMTFEEVVGLGPPVKPDSEDVHIRVSLRSPPRIIRNCNALLKGRHKRKVLTSASAVERYAIRRGVSELASHPSLKEVHHLVHQLRNDEPESHNEMHYTYSLQRENHTNVKVCTFKINGDILADLSADLDIPRGTLAVIAYLLGISASKEWVPEGYKVVARREIDNFFTIVDRHLDRLRRLTA